MNQLNIEPNIIGNKTEDCDQSRSTESMDIEKENNLNVQPKTTTAEEMTDCKQQ
jgi:hypothetical protein